MTGVSPSDDEVRVKAYDLWISGGRIEGRDKEDWFRAKAILSATGARRTEPSGPHGLVAEMIDAASSVMNAAASAVFGMLGSGSVDPEAAKRKVEAPGAGRNSEPGAALEDAERVQRVEAEARIEAAKNEAAVGTPSGKVSPVGGVNPDG